MNLPSRRAPGHASARRRPLRSLTVALTVLLAATACTPSPSGTGSPDAGTGGPTSGPGATNGASPGAEPPSPLGQVLAGPDESTREAAETAVAGMDVAEKAGQVLVGQLGAAGTDPASIRELNLGGVIVMGDAVPVATDGTHDVEALSGRLEETQQALSAGRDWSGIVSVDQEGGLVARVKEPLTEWPTPMSYGAVRAAEVAPAEGTDGPGDQGADAGGADAAGTDALDHAARGHYLMGSELADLGFTMDFAPSVDVTVGADDPTIGARSFSSDPEAVTALGLAATNGLLHAGILPAPKHFPGHGSVGADSHVTAPLQDAGVEDLRSRDWLPFEALLAGAGDDAGVGTDHTVSTPYTPMVMMGHIVVPGLEPGVPSSVSAAAYDALRRLGAPEGGSDAGAGAGDDDAGTPDAGTADTGATDAGTPDAAEGYEGVVVTDALNMGALVERYGPDEAPVRALAAGADLLLMPSSLTGARDAIVAAVESGEVPGERLDEAAERVVTMLMWRDGVEQELRSASPEELSAGLFGDGEPAGKPAGEGAAATETGGGGIAALQGIDADTASRDLSAAAVTMVSGTCGEPLVGDSLQVTGGDARDRQRLAEATEAAGLAVGSGPVVNLVGTARGVGGGDVVVALDAPFGLAASSVPEGGALVALYGRTPGAFAVLVDVLTGQAEAPGALPVQVGEWPVGTGC